ncbi:MAG: hypothetical protein AB9882_09375 [Ignavibacteriaceae bacterium]
MVLEEKNWDIKKGDFQKKHIHEEHKNFKKREKTDKFFLYLFIVVLAGVIIYAVTHI